MSVSPDWLAALAHCRPSDLHCVSRLVDLLITADRAAAETARVMLAAAPPPETHEEARLRCEKIVEYLEHVAAGDADVGPAEIQPLDELGDALDGISWWNGLTPAVRRFWLEHANSARPAAAYLAFKRSSEARASAQLR